MRAIFIAFATLISITGSLQAQVAAPRLNAARSISFNLFNPAVLSWGGPSRVGVGFFDVDFDLETGGLKLNLASGDGSFVQARYVGESFAFHAERISLDLDINPLFGVGTLNIDSSTFAGAYQAGGVFSFGIGQQTDSGNFNGPVDEDKLPLAGVTLVLGEVFYLGAAFGEETVEDGVNTVERSVNAAGAAFFSRGESFGYHLEFYSEKRDAAQDAVTGQTEPEENNTGVTAEVIFLGGLLLGYEVIDAEKTNPDGTPGDEAEDATTFLGWVGTEGLAVTASATTSESTAPITGNITRFEIFTVNVAWMF